MGLVDKLRLLRDRLAVAAQTVLLPTGLFLAYFLGVGLSRVLMRLLQPGLLRPPRPETGTFWRRAQGYGPDEDDCLRQS